ncbi:hypothetical protein PR048_026551 [Dryococelus australis]|uniref:Retrovirus-related Pol polyprotein from transposon TNT 1-94-like beta-barrel domain-containing protein n=1 Tax=Dryococelus australis TaxID=614101 RepID=A0ABQ9GLN8_9NEOP|nr:hypothetical protein PR048_026551 [Dryococelus australis]
MQEYAASIQRLNKKVTKGWIIFNDEMISNLLLSGLPADEYEVFVQNLLREPNLTTRVTTSNGEHNEVALASTVNKRAQFTRKNFEARNSRNVVNKGSKEVIVTVLSGRSLDILVSFALKSNVFSVMSLDIGPKSVSRNIIIRDEGENHVQKVKTIGCVSVFALMASKECNQWFLDSAATEHMTSCRELITYFTPSRGHVTLGKGEIKVEGIAAHNIHVNFTKDQAVGVLKDKCVFNAFVKEGLYVLQSDVSINVP